MEIYAGHYFTKYSDTKHKPDWTKQEYVIIITFALYSLEEGFFISH